MIVCGDSHTATHGAFGALAFGIGTSEVEHVLATQTLMQKKSNKTELGLWGELLLILTSRNPSLAIQSWHIDPKSIFDFNDSNVKVEVKTTLKNERIHSFSNNQVIKSQAHRTIIYSIITSKIHNGVSILELISKIGNKVSHTDLIDLNSKILSVAGEELDDFTNKFDLNSAIKQVKFYDSNSLSSIDLNCIPRNIEKVKFDINFENITPIERADISINYV